MFFNGKGGVGKTSLSTGTAIHLADSGKRVTKALPAWGRIRI
jgi:arsenite-transporting ATPase